jgi:predicted transcriptional regulator
MSKKIQVSFSDKQIELLDRLKGEFGETDADVIRCIVLAWLAEKSFISTVIKQRMDREGRIGAKDDERHPE